MQKWLQVKKKIRCLGNSHIAPSSCGVCEIISRDKVICKLCLNKIMKLGKRNTVRNRNLILNIKARLTHKL